MKLSARHPDRATLALHAGGDLGRFQAWRTARHVARCAECSEEIAAFEQVRAMLPELNELSEISWNQIAEEMSANIRLGLAAGECVREAVPARPPALFRGARMAIALGSAAALIVTALVLQHPTAPIMSASVPVAQTTKDGIETVSGDRGFALIHMNMNAREVSYTPGAQGTMGASYVDPSTGYVTMTKVYAE